VGASANKLHSSPSHGPFQLALPRKEDGRVAGHLLLRPVAELKRDRRDVVAPVPLARLVARGPEPVEIWGDMGRYGEIWGDMGRYGEICALTNALKSLRDQLEKPESALG